MNKYIKKIDDVARENLRKIKYAYKDLDRAEKLMTEANASHDERRILNGKGNLLDAQAELKKARDKAVEALDRLRAMRNEMVQDEVRRTTVNPEAVDMAALELLKSGIMRPADYDSMLTKFSNNPTMVRVLTRYAEDAANAEKDDPGARAAFGTIKVRARDMVDPEADVVAFDAMVDLFSRAVRNRHLIPHYDGLAAQFTGITNPAVPLSDEANSESE